MAFQEVGSETTVQTVKAFVILRQSGLNAEDKKRIISMAGSYEPSKIEAAMRALSTKVLGQGDSARKKIYPVNYMEDDVDDINYAGEDEMDEDSILMALLEEGDESALVIQEFEDSIVQVYQDSPELSMAFSAYQEARAKIRDKIRGRGFWPIRSFPKGKGKTKTGKNFFKKRQSLSERIASSNCRICGVRGHWKEECPQKDRQGGAEANMLTTVEEQLIGEILEDLPLDNMATWEARQHGHTHSHPGYHLRIPMLMMNSFVWLSQELPKFCM